MVWRVALGQYDILGLISVFTVRLKLIMKVLVEEMTGIEEKKKWDQPVSKNTRDEFLAILQQLLLLKKTEFPRCVVPVGHDSSELPMLLVLADGSQSAYCAPSLPVLKDVGRNIQLQAGDGQDEGCTNKEDFDTSDGIDGGSDGDALEDS